VDQSSSTEGVLKNTELARSLAQSVYTANGSELSRHGFELKFQSAWLVHQNGPTSFEYIDAELSQCMVVEITASPDSFVIDWKCNTLATFLPHDTKNELLRRDCFDAGYSLVGLYWPETPQLILRDRADWSVERCGSHPGIKAPSQQ